MALFQSEDELRRKENLKRMEDERVRFAGEMEAMGFRPERMLFFSREDGSFVALARHEGRFAMIDSPKFGAEGKFTLHLTDAPRYDREDVFEKGTGLNGAFGFGTKAARGYNLFILDEDGLYVKVPVVSGRNSWLEVNYKKNPLLKTKRRRGDANVMWDFLPIDGQGMKRIDMLLESHYLADANRAPKPAEAAPEVAQNAGANSGANSTEASAFYPALEAAIHSEGLDRHTRVHFGEIQRTDNCLSVVLHAADDCELSYAVEQGKTGYHEEHLTPEQATEKCLAFLRKRKEFEEYMRGIES